MSMTIVRAGCDDAATCADLRRQMDLESGEDARPGFEKEYVTYFRAHLEDLPTWIARTNDGTPAGFVQTSVVHRPPSLTRDARPHLYVGVVFVVPQERGSGLAARMLGVVDEWADTQGVDRMMLNARPRARTLYERIGFEPPAEKHMHRDGPFAVHRGTTNGELT